MSTVDLSSTCRRWQSGRDGGSSLLRGAARVLTRVPHYFSAPYISEFECQALNDRVALGQADLLLKAIRDGERATAWPGLPASSFAGRGIESKVKYWEDQQILDQLATRSITMPLWGVSVSRRVAEGYGDRFLFIIDGPFRGIAATSHSGELPEQQEVITGGTYTVLEQRDEGHTTVVTLREDDPIGTWVTPDRV